MEDSKMLDELIIAQTKAAKAQIELLETKLESANAENLKLMKENTLLICKDIRYPSYEKLELENKKLTDEITELKKQLELRTVCNQDNLLRDGARINNLENENVKLRAALEEIVTLSTYAGKITKDVEHYMTMRIASRAPEIAREALKNPASDGRGE